MRSSFSLFQPTHSILSLPLSFSPHSMADSVSGQTVVDPKGYLTSLGSVRVSSAAEVSDIKKARTLLRSVTSTNPKHAPGWVAAARLEEVAGALPEARRLASKGCELCPGSEDVWLEAARLQANMASSRSVLARGVASLPRSVRLWLQAARLEAPDAAAQSRVLRKALERVPDSVRLWKAAVELAPEADARVLLARAVECCPQHTELWLALARLETYANAQKVLNRARLAVPTDRAIWIAAAKLEEAAGKTGTVPRIIGRGLSSLVTNGVETDREAWLAEAEAAEKATPPYPATCAAIVEAVVGSGVEEEDRERTWLADAAEASGRGSAATARAILAAATAAFPAKEGVWRRAAELERTSGDAGALDALLRRAVTYCPQVREKWRGDGKKRGRRKKRRGGPVFCGEGRAPIPSYPPSAAAGDFQRVPVHSGPPPRDIKRENCERSINRPGGEPKPTAVTHNPRTVGALDRDKGKSLSSPFPSLCNTRARTYTGRSAVADGGQGKVDRGRRARRPASAGGSIRGQP